jgi:TolB protein
MSDRSRLGVASRGRGKACVFAFLLLCSALVPTVRAQGVPSFELQVERSGVERMSIELVEPRIESSLPAAREGAYELASRLVTDLVYSGLFSFRGGVPAGVRRPPHAPDAWRNDHAEDPVARIDLTLSGLRPDEMVWTIRVLDAGSERQLLGKRYVVDLARHDREVHHLADEIVRALTGDVGIAQTRILFSRQVEAARELFLVDYDGRNLRQITRNGSLNLLPRWSPDASKICYTSYWQGRQRLLVLDGSTGKSRNVAEFAGLNFGADWAPGGDEIAVTLTHEGDPEIYRIGLDGKIRARLTFGPAIDCSPVFDPTGNQIAYTSDRTGAPQLFRMSKDGTDRLRLTREGSCNNAPSWSPRGDRIAYVGRISGKFQIFLVTPDGAVTQAVTTAADGNNEDPAWAPDGRHLVVTSDRDGIRRLWVIDVDGGTARPLSSGSVDDNGPHWSSSPRGGSNAAPVPAASSAAGR